RRFPGSETVRVPDTLFALSEGPQRHSLSGNSVFIRRQGQPRRTRTNSQDGGSGSVGNVVRPSGPAGLREGSGTRRRLGTGSLGQRENACHRSPDCLSQLATGCSGTTFKIGWIFRTNSSPNPYR